jgi:ATP-dependent Clp protease ATP-binding subunit ClpA
VFERFTDKAKAVVHGAQVEAQARAASHVRSEHLLAALLAGPESVAQRALLRDGVDLPALLRTVRGVPDPASPSTAPQDDAQALAALGIDLDEVRRQVEDAFGPGALERTRAAQRGGRRGFARWDRSAKKVLELSLREALRMRHNYIGTEHVLLGLLHPGTGAGQELLTGAGVRLESARTHVADLLRDRAAG